jgi:hypothetical protein
MIGCHDSHVDMKTKNCNMLPKMRSRQGSTDNVFSFALGNNRQDLSKISTKDVATPLWPSVGVKPNTPKVRDLESSGTPGCLGFDSIGQNTSDWGVLGVIGKVLKCRCLK